MRNEAEVIDIGGSGISLGKHTSLISHANQNQEAIAAHTKDQQPDSMHSVCINV